MHEQVCHRYRERPYPGMDLEERGKQLQAVLEKYMVRPSKMPTPRPEPPTPVALDDMALLQRAKQGKGGAAFASLWAGDTSGYPSQSEADIALCQRPWYGGRMEMPSGWIGFSVNPV